MQRLVTRYAIVAAGLMLIGCASRKPPTRELESASRSIGAAQEAGAEEHPQAMLHLNLARESLTAGERYIAEREMADARLLLRRARADAEMAGALARLGNTRVEATRIAAQARELERQLRSASR
ncbi:MAG TPA: DUF4398 domain-containing protein [Polyangiaceae bacterium]|jgi:hypothetical protein|nr:DUF4398 domain-containing protein [Polyangiaceae bacterium]